MVQTWRGFAIACLVVLIPVALVGAAGWYYESFALWPGQALPSHIHWCGRDFAKDPGPSVPLTKARPTIPRSRANEPVTEPWQRVGTLDFVLFSSPAVFATPWSAETQRKFDLFACTAELYVKTGPNSFVGYGLEGSA
jgi:hypothetical protein